MRWLSSTSAVRPLSGRRTRGCRVVTTSLTARVLLANQLRSLPEIDWTVVSGDAYDDPPEGVASRSSPSAGSSPSPTSPSFARLWRYLRRQRFDFVQTHTPKASFLGLPAARLAGTPAIYTIHGALYFAGQRPDGQRPGLVLRAVVLRVGHRVLVQSREDETVLPAARICRRRQAGLRGQRHRHGPVPRNRWRRRCRRTDPSW